MRFLPWRETALHTTLYDARDAIVYVDHSRSPDREFDRD
jgi:ribulose-5-phosphate 4-epimerase/fuculose-1-phosphate aldolase